MAYQRASAALGTGSALAHLPFVRVEGRPLRAEKSKGLEDRGVVLVRRLDPLARVSSLRPSRPTDHASADATTGGRRRPAERRHLRIAGGRASDTAPRTPHRAWRCCGRPAAPPCLLGKTWGYDDTGIWVSDGCSAAVPRRPVAQAQATEKKKPLEHIPNARVPALRRREGPDLLPALQLRALPESAESRSDLRRLLRQDADGAAAAGHPAAEVLRAVLRAGSSRRSFATTCTSGRRTRRRAIRRRSSAPAT